jgi:hypothetical protein
MVAPSDGPRTVEETDLSVNLGEAIPRGAATPVVRLRCTDLSVGTARPHADTGRRSNDP